MTGGRAREPFSRCFGRLSSSALRHEGEMPP